MFTVTTKHRKINIVGVASETKKTLTPCVVCKGNYGLWKITVLKRIRQLSERKCLQNQLFSAALRLATVSATVRILEYALKTVIIAAITLYAPRGTLPVPCSH